MFEAYLELAHSYHEGWEAAHNTVKEITKQLYKKYPNASFSEGDCGVLAFYFLKHFGKGSVATVITEDEPERALHVLYYDGNDYYDERGAIDSDEVKQAYADNYSEDSIQIHDGYGIKDTDKILKMTHPRMTPAQIKELLT